MQNYEEKLNDVKRIYNKQFNEESKKKMEGVIEIYKNQEQKLPLYEERKISDLKALESILGPLSLQRRYAGIRTILGQSTVIVKVNSPIRLIFDESDNSLQLQFSISPFLEETDSETK